MYRYMIQILMKVMQVYAMMWNVYEHQDYNKMMYL